MKITIDLTTEEADGFPQWLGVDKNLGDLVQEAIQCEKNKQALYRFQREVFNGHDWSKETLSRHLTSDFIDHAAMPGDLPGFDGVQSRFSAWASAFENAMEEDVEVVAQGDIVAVLYDLHAKHTGEYVGVPPTNRDVVIPGIEFVRFRDGKICEHWGIYDFLSTAEEIGADMLFVPRQDPGMPRRPEVPWRRELPDADEISGRN